MRIIFCSLLFLSLCFPLDAQKLNEKWEKWLNEEVVYIISKKEREVFLSLQSDREREKFVDSFWAVRDPTPGTPANEFKEEHYRRIEYANKLFGRGSAKPGWKTDMGKIYIILGEPLEKQRFETYEYLNPVELWYYHGEIGYGFPPYFYVMFYREHGIGDWKLYSPAGDGPERLLNPSAWNESITREEAYRIIKRANSELANVSLSLIPGESIDPTGRIVSLSSDLLINNVISLPSKKVESLWAEEFLKIKDIVISDYSVNFVRSKSTAFLHKGDTMNFIYYSIEPERIVFNQYQKKVYAALKINIRITDLKGNGIYQEEKDVSIEMDEEKFRVLEGRICAIQGLIPVLEGDYNINILLRNINSKDFSSFEKTFHSPSSSENYSISTILLGYGKQSSIPKSLRAFKFGDQQLFVDSSKFFTPKDTMVFYVEIYNFQSAPKDWKIIWKITSGDKVFLKKEENLEKSLLKNVPLSSLPPDYYKLRVSVVDGKGNEILYSQEDFTVLGIPSIPRPWIYSQSYQDYSQFFETYMEQLINKGAPEAALEFIKGKELKGKVLLLAGKAKYLTGDYDSAINYLLSLKEYSDPSILLLLARSFENKKDLNSAISYYEKALERTGESVDLINSIAICYYKMGRKEEAKKYFERSLKLNPEQNEIVEILKKL
ncbi:MAG: GWxTD domain-containing protein [Candidatus Aminicenantia bacterium]